MVTLNNGPLELVLLPELGGSIGRFDWREGEAFHPILRGHDAPSTPLDAGCFPLVPYSNRIRGGHFRFRGREVTIAPNMEGDRSPLHGQGWLAPWDVVAASVQEAELRYHHMAGEWPWTYEARQHFRLADDLLEVELSCRNLTAEDMPCGLGFHPYFPCRSSTFLSTCVENVWTIDDDILPVNHVPANGRYDLSHGPICGRGLDNGYDGWSGEACVQDAQLPFAVTLSSRTRFFQLYSPPAGGLFVAEPVTHANAAVNEPEEKWGDLGMKVLAPGEAMCLKMAISVVNPVT